MTIEQKQFVDLIKNYRDEVKKAYKLVVRANHSPSQRKGYLDKSLNIQYEYHGLGCLITYPAYSVDFNFGSENGGFELWFVIGYLKFKEKDYPLLASLQEEDFKLMLEQLILLNVLYQDVGTGLYYLS